MIVREGWNGKVGMGNDGNGRVVKGWMGLYGKGGMEEM